MANVKKNTLTALPLFVFRKQEINLHVKGILPVPGGKETENLEQERLYKETLLLFNNLLP